MRISDWSSDVGSSDLHAALRLGQARGGQCALDDILVEPPVGEVRDPHAADQHREPGQFLIMRIIGGKDHLEMIGHAAGEFDETADNAGIAADLAERQPGDDEPAEHQQRDLRSEEHTSELQSLMRISYAVFCLKKKNKQTKNTY